MAARIPTGLTVAEGRRFGLTVGGAFLLVSAVTWYRGHWTITVALGCIGIALVLAGLLAPTRMGPVERAWMRMAHAISHVTAPVAMALIYFGVITPAGLLRRAIGGDPLHHVEHEGTLWKSRLARPRSATSMERQF
jgi:saxitoxin biosynthesis operon SxtJ-like protein